MNKIRLNILRLSFVFLSCWPPLLLADSDQKEPLWEVGVAAGYIHTPQYMGSDENYSFLLGIPYLVYRGDIFSADREGMRGLLFESGKLSLDLGFSFGLPVDNDNKAREGMPDLHLTGQAGPRLNWTLDTAPDLPDISLHLPVRYTMDTHGESLGWVAEPSIKVKKENLGTDGRFSARMDLGLLYAGRRFNEYYYNVDSQYVTANRPAYSADSGLHSTFLHLSSEYEVNDDLTVGTFLRLRTLAPGVVDDSPLVKDKNHISFGIGFAWSIWQSKTFSK